MGQAIKNVVRDNPKLGLRKLVHKVEEALPNSSWHPKRERLRSFLAEGGFKKRKKPLKPPLSAVNKAKRLAFAEKWLSGN